MEANKYKQRRKTKYSIDFPICQTEKTNDVSKKKERDKY
jgi:hypothetical protein